MKKTAKSVTISLLDGSSRRILKKSVVSIVEQRNIMGG